MHGGVPGSSIEPPPFAVEIEVMREMGWTWQDVQETPADVLDVIIEQMASSRHWTAEKQRMQKAMQAQQQRQR
jgi:hypothetical protein